MTGPDRTDPDLARWVNLLSAFWLAALICGFSGNFTAAMAGVFTATVFAADLTTAADAFGALGLLDNLGGPEATGFPATFDDCLTAALMAGFATA